MICFWKHARVAMEGLFSRQELLNFKKRCASRICFAKKQADMRSTKGTCKQNKSLNIYNYRLLTPTCFETLWFKEAMALFATRFFAPLHLWPVPRLLQTSPIFCFSFWMLPGTIWAKEGPDAKEPKFCASTNMPWRQAERQKEWEADGTLVWKCVFFVGQKRLGPRPPF